MLDKDRHDCYDSLLLRIYQKRDDQTPKHREQRVKWLNSPTKRQTYSAEINDHLGGGDFLSAQAFPELKEGCNDLQVSSIYLRVDVGLKVS